MASSCQLVPLWQGCLALATQSKRHPQSVLSCNLVSRASTNSRTSTPQAVGQGSEGRDIDATRRDFLKLAVATVSTAASLPALAEESATAPAVVVEIDPSTVPPDSTSTTATTDATPSDGTPTSAADDSAPADSTTDQTSEKPADEAKPQPRPGPDTTITARVFFDIILCEGTSRPGRTLGDPSNICSAEEGEALGRIVIGLYGKLVPQTVSNFLAMCSGKAGSSYQGTLFHKIVPGGYILGGKQGSKLKGEVEPPQNLERNTEAVKAGAFDVLHQRPGTVSLALGVNDDEEDRKLSPEYRNVEFLITTGPGPCPELDGANIVMGTVLEGLDIVRAIAEVPAYRPNERIKQFNDLAEFLGDDRAAAARSNWDKPLRNVVISKCGMVKLKPMPLPNGLP